ncbi:citrinin biosynthesis oxidoreductase CtnB [Colletotrichum falcatum]|nr:citrinin biosynthesis oxidoreductase CtnB [Colletotrichum falcatum]
MLPRRILCLHGDGTNAMVFAAQTRHLRRALEPHGIELVYATGPFECEPGYGVSPFFDDCGPFYRWCSNDPRDGYSQATTAEDDAAESTAMAAGIVDMFQDLRYEFGHTTDGEDGRDGFVGILGFSSAAAIVAGILAVQNNGDDELCPAWYRFRFGVLVNGTGPPARLPIIGGGGGSKPRPIEVPTLSVVGKQDQWRGQSKLLNTYFDKDSVTCLEFDNGHKIPSEDGQVKEMASAILDMVRKTEECIQV